MKKLLLTAMVFCSCTLSTNSSAVSAGDIAYRTGAGLGGLACLNAAYSLVDSGVRFAKSSVKSLTKSGDIFGAIDRSGFAFSNAIMAAGFAYLGYRCFQAACCQAEEQAND